MKKIPKRINILGIIYKVEFFDVIEDVDINGKDKLWGQIDYDSRSIRIFDDGKKLDDLLQTLIHEILHGLLDALHIKMSEKNLDRLATGISDTFIRNGMIKVK